MSEPATRILLVEDNPAEAELVRDMLAGSTRPVFEVDHVPRLAAALGRLETTTYAAVLLDFTLPDSAGLDTYRRLAERHPRLPVVVLTNLDDEEVAGRAVREGAQDYLLKRDATPTLLSRSLRYAIERQRAEMALRESEARYTLAVEGANDSVWDWDLLTGETYFSPRWRVLLGLEDGELDGHIDEWLRRVHGEDRPLLDHAIEMHIAGATPHFEHEHRLRARDRGWVWVLARGIALRDSSGRAYRMAGSLSDISARKHAEEQLLHDAFHDALTDLPNRTLFTDRLGLALDQLRRRDGHGFAVLFLDLDRFKNVNDSLGHTVGDRLLIGVANRLKACVRPGDSVARLGGDEFGVLLADTQQAAAANRVAERIHGAMREPFRIDAHEVYASASIGIAVASRAYERGEDLLRDADTAMYRAKAAGRACSQVFDTTMHRNVTALLKMEMDLRRAVERREFVMHYQPIIALGTGEIVGFEGLIRWVHPERGLVYPQSFIAVAEETGLIQPIGWMALGEACRQIKAWQQRFPRDPALYVSVNVSGKLFAQHDIVDRIAALIERTGIEPSALRLEITENVLLDDTTAAFEALPRLRQLGVRFSCDDFGTGYSSLSYLQRFSYDTLKIDRTFIAAMDTKADNRVIVETIVALGQMLGMNVIAEGVETQDQLHRLKAMQCPQAQGFWFSHPVDTESASALLVNGRVN